MNVVVDTSVWSLAYRRDRDPGEPAVRELATLVREGRVLLLGAVRQELLSGIRSAKQFESLRTHLRAFLDVEIDIADHEQAATYCNRCRSRGVQGAAVDFLICAVAARHRSAIFTTDRDFDHYARVLGVVLHKPRHPAS